MDRPRWLMNKTLDKIVEKDQSEVDEFEREYGNDLKACLSKRSVDKSKKKD